MREAIDKAFLLKFGTRLNELRILKNLSYRKMAQQCKIDHSDIAKYELGETNITLLTLNELAKGLDVDPKELLNF
jgi:transcriptional regulator with XRE-family HTH domain